MQLQVFYDPWCTKERLPRERGTRRYERPKQKPHILDHRSQIACCSCWKQPKSFELLHHVLKNSKTSSLVGCQALRNDTRRETASLDKGGDREENLFLPKHKLDYCGALWVWMLPVFASSQIISGPQPVCSQY